MTPTTAAAMSAAEFAYLADVVRQDAAIVLEPGKEYLVESRLQPLARKTGLGSLAELVRALRAGNRALREQVVDAMTTNETSFFRDAHPWEALRKSVLPELIARRAATRSLDIWCGACSSGQEPYTLGLLLKEHFASQLVGWRVRILATDISESMLERTRKGRYSQLEVNRGLPAPMLVRYFAREGLEWQLEPEVRAMVERRRFNLADESGWGLMGPFDLVLVRNVLIYFDVSTKQRILRNIRRRLRPDGTFFLGSCETTIGLVDDFERVVDGKTIYYTCR
jgi:chemotaxis protein methyltransferase CheR